MKFVHLAPRSMIGRIKRNGIRAGRGRRGAGVYAVPLFKVSRENYRYDDDEPSYESDPLPSTDMWRPLFDERRGRGNRPVAIVFSLPDELWPIDLYLTITRDMAGSFSDDSHPSESLGYCIHPGALASLEEWAAIDLQIQVHNPSALGFLLNQWLEANPSVYEGFDDSIEAVIRAPVPASAIQRLVPLSQRNRKAKVRVNQELRRSPERDIE